MRIVHFFEYFNNGGIENVLVNILTHLNIEADKEILCTVKRNHNYDKELEKKNILWNIYTNKNIENPMIRFFYNCRAIKNYCKEKRPDVLHIHIYNPLGIWYARIGRKYAKKVILHAHGSYYKNNFFKIKNLFSLTKLFLPKDVVKIACSRKAASFCFGKKSHVSVLHNTFDIKKLSKGKPTYRTQYHLEKRWILLSVGRLESQKNMLLLIDVLKELKKKKKNAFLIIVGSGSQKKRIEKKVKKLHLEKDFLLLENVADIENIYASSNFYISVPLYEPFGLSVVEAQACHLPTLVSNAVSTETRISSYITYICQLDIKNIVSKMLEMESKCKLKPYKSMYFTPMKKYIQKMEKMYTSKK